MSILPPAENVSLSFQQEIKNIDAHNKIPDKVIFLVFIVFLYGVIFLLLYYIFKHNKFSPEFFEIIGLIDIIVGIFFHISGFFVFR